MRLKYIEPWLDDQVTPVKEVGTFNWAGKEMKVERSIFRDNVGWLFTHNSGRRYFLAISEVMATIELMETNLEKWKSQQTKLLDGGALSED